MPFSQTVQEHTDEYWDNHYNDFLKPLIESAAPLEPYRSYPLRNDILEQTVKDLITAPIVVADLTDANPNVYWELGVRQSFKHGTITIAEYGTHLPFDIGRKGTLYYVALGSTAYTKNASFVKHFTAALKDCLNNPESPDSAVLQAITGRGTLYQIVRKGEILRKLTALYQENGMNLTIVNKIKDMCDENSQLRSLNKQKECTNVKTPLHVICAENLLVNQYLETHDSFYLQAQKYFFYATAFSEQISEWPRTPSITEQWLSSHAATVRSLLEEFNTLVETEVARLLSSF